VEDAKACMRLWKVFSREIGIYPVRIVWNSLFGSKEARFSEPEGCGIRNLEDVCGPMSSVLRFNQETDLGAITEKVAVAYQWGVNNSQEKELLRVSMVNYEGMLLFDSVIQPSKPLEHVPLFNLYLFDPSFGIPLKYLTQMLASILDKKVVIGCDLQPLFDMLKVKQHLVVCSKRDLLSRPEISSVSHESHLLAK
jgi:hypothetical protein